MSSDNEYYGNYNDHPEAVKIRGWTKNEQAHLILLPADLKTWPTNPTSY